MKPFAPPPLPWPNLALEPLVPLIGQANRAVAEYNGALYGMPNPAILLSPLTTQEAVLSSRIEGTQASLLDVYKFEAGDQPASESLGEDIHEILNYRRALGRAEAALKKRPFNLNLLLELHGILLDSVRGADKGRGRFRPVQNWIGRPGSAIEHASYVPPPPHRVAELMGHWEKFYHADFADPLVQLGIIHAQFELIHPFLDGNGRLGRILVPLFLAEKGVLARPAFYLSTYLEAHRDEYVGHLRELSHGPDHWGRWVAFFLEAVAAQAQAQARTARAIIALCKKQQQRVVAATRSQWALALLDRLFERPVFTATDLLDWPKGPSKPMVAILLAQLHKAEVLQVVQPARGRRPQIWAFAELINLCEGRKVF